MPTPPPEILRLTAEQRRATADLLASLTPDQWREPSGCVGWSVHHLAAHLTLPFHSSARRVVGQTLKARGSFDRAADAMARADAAAYRPEELVAQLRSHAEDPWLPPGGGVAGALSHDVFHSYDLTEALGREPVTTPERVEPVLRHLKPFHVSAFGTSLKDTRWTATDLALTIGNGERHVVAPAVDLAAMLSGRRPVPV